MKSLSELGGVDIGRIWMKAHLVTYPRQWSQGRRMYPSSSSIVLTTCYPGPCRVKMVQWCAATKRWRMHKQIWGRLSNASKSLERYRDQIPSVKMCRFDFISLWYCTPVDVWEVDLGFLCAYLEYINLLLVGLQIIYREKLFVNCDEIVLTA